MAATKKKTSNRGKRQTKQEPAAGNFSTEIVLGRGKCRSGRRDHR